MKNEFYHFHDKDLTVHPGPWSQWKCQEQLQWGSCFLTTCREHVLFYYNWDRSSCSEVVVFKEHALFNYDTSFCGWLHPCLRTDVRFGSDENQASIFPSKIHCSILHSWEESVGDERGRIKRNKSVVRQIPVYTYMYVYVYVYTHVCTCLTSAQRFTVVSFDQ